jgi:hypothetical protein
MSPIYDFKVTNYFEQHYAKGFHELPAKPEFAGNVQGFLAI